MPEFQDRQGKEILFNHVIAYCTTGISFAKTKGIPPKEYGEYIGETFKPFWNPEEGFPSFANGLMFMLAGMHPDNDMQIIDQSDIMLRFKMKNVDFAFQQGPAFGTTYEELLECSEGILTTIAEHMNTSFAHKVTDKIWYEVTLKTK